MPATTFANSDQGRITGALQWQREEFLHLGPRDGLGHERAHGTPCQQCFVGAQAHAGGVRGSG